MSEARKGRRNPETISKTERKGRKSRRLPGGSSLVESGGGEGGKVGSSGWQLHSQKIETV
jgi:hypothetical protein